MDDTPFVKVMKEEKPDKGNSIVYFDEMIAVEGQVDREIELHRLAERLVASMQCSKTAACWHCHTWPAMRKST